VVRAYTLSYHGQLNVSGELLLRRRKKIWCSVVYLVCSGNWLAISEGNPGVGHDSNLMLLIAPSTH
jgi:hypothetical protein